MPGDPPAYPLDDELVAVVHDHLRSLARRIGRGNEVTSQTTSIVNEAWIRLRNHGQPLNSERFAALAAATVRSVVVDSVRRTRRAKRGGGWVRSPLESIDVESDGRGPPFHNGRHREDTLDVLELDTALNELQTSNERRAQVVVLRFFGGLSVSQVAVALGIGERTVEHEWHLARAWLRARLEPA